VTYYDLARAPRKRVQATTAAAFATVAPAAPSTVTVRVKDAATGGAVAGATVVAFSDFAARAGQEGRTDANGVCTLALQAGTQAIERLYVYPRPIYWGAFRMAVSVGAPIDVSLDPVQLTHLDALRYYAPNGGVVNAGAGLVVGVVDTGVDLAHPDLALLGGHNTVVGEDPRDFGDNGEGHGTHVAGIIGAQTRLAANRTLGLAPFAGLRSYRVFGLRQKQASNYSITKAIDQAIADECDIINLSLSSASSDDAIAAAVEDAYYAGTLVIAAAGNDGRKPVGYPAALNFVIGVSALGRKGTVPAQTIDEGDVGAPFGNDADEFIALFSNVGSEIDVTAPGVGIVSTVPPATFGVMSGTSMAAPYVTGYAARLISQDQGILAMPRDAARADAMIQLLLGAAKTLGFAQQFEGRGLPR
jgi:subtilisin